MRDFGPLAASNRANQPNDGVRSANGKRSAFSVADMKACPAAKIREIREALIAEGYTNLNDQAAALGLSRSTTWTIINGSHKTSGLSAVVIARILSVPRLRPRVRNKVFKYIVEKSAGHDGDSKLTKEHAFLGGMADGRAPFK